ncbi:SLC13 family permease [Actinomarinicola tropica]|uniref:SLC13 family permease n=1 Tax=Actinomarinicola tropica TaxID=2789776 RepID=A0A5Q2RDL6_9ACTN|nr:SLC13 family permease [Actinomarinicola tropica]QGG93743.1 SLC13 family permease [Actinomarinicola tropica]
MGWDAWITLAVIAAMVVALVSERVAPTVAVTTAVVVLYLVDVVDFDGAFGGLSNAAPVTVAALYVIAGAAEQTGALARGLDGVLGARRPASERRAVWRVSRVAAGGSAFVPNTPLVALMVPSIEQWSRRHGFSSSRVLMPLSYAAVLGGVITILGTSTNLVVNGFLDAAGEEPFGVFSITPVGLPVALAGVAVLVLLSPLLLPRRSTPGDQLGSGREYTIEMVVTAGGGLAGASVADAGFAELDGLSLAAVDRLGQVVAPDADVRLEPGDHLLFTGPIDRIHDLEKVDGLVTTHEELSAPTGPDRSHMFEAVVADTGPLAGHTLKQLGFHERHGATVLAIHRAGDPARGPIGDVVLRGGDVLVLVAEDGFRDRIRDLPDFLVVAPMEASAPVRRPGGRIVQLVVLALLLATGSGLVDLTPASIAGAWALVVTRVVSPTEAVRSVNFNVIALVAMSFGLGAAAAESGLAERFAEVLVDLGDPLGHVGVLVGVMAATLVLTELLSNNAAAALMFPVAAAISTETGTDLRSLALGVLVMASCSFLSPIGYQTNTMVWSIGGYRFSDFTRVGVPLTAVVFATTALVIPLAYPLAT